MIQYESTDSATVLKVASETTVGTVLANITNVDGKTQSYKIYNSRSNPIENTEPLTEAATLVVTSEHGDSHRKEYEIMIQSTPFVKLYSQPNVASGQRNSRPVEYTTTWHDTIGDAITNAHGTELSTITVWQGTYVENIDFGGKEIHLTSDDPTDSNIMNNTIIRPDNTNFPVVTINGNQSKTVLEGFKITGGATGLYFEVATPMIRNNDIEATNSTVRLKGADSTLLFNTMFAKAGTSIYMTDSKPTISNNNITDSFKKAIYMTNSEPVINDNTIFGTDGIVIEGSTPTFYRNEIFTYIRNGVIVDADSNVKNEDGDLWQVFNVPYASQADVENYTDGATSNTFIPLGGSAQGDYTLFERTQRETAAENLELSPATATSKDGQDFTIVATYTLAESFSNGTVTYDLDEAIDLDNVHVTINGVKRAVKIMEIDGNKIHISDIYAEAGENIVLEIVQSSYLYEKENSPSSSARLRVDNGYNVSISSDRDGKSTLYSPSVEEKDNVEIENNLEIIGSEGTAYEITENDGTPFWSYTLKVYRDEMPERLQNISEWEIEIRNDLGVTHVLRTNQFDDNILQFDNIEKEIDGQTITEESIKEARFEPKQETPD